MGGVLSRLDWPSAGQVATGCGCGAVLYVWLRTNSAFGSDWREAALRATLTSAGVAGALAASEALSDWAMRRRPPADGAVVITGCDSGLGFSLALHAHEELGLTVFACCLRTDGEGARRLEERCSGPRMRVLQMDVTDTGSVNKARDAVKSALGGEEQPEKSDEKESGTKEADGKALKLLGVVNNAGVMVFGEFEWQTEEQWSQQVEVNLLGALRTAHAFLPLLRAHRGRLLTVTSHCALQPLPGLGPYAACKAALAAWSSALRVEMAAHSVRVVTLIPGSFTGHSNLMARQAEHAEKQRAALSADQADYYGDYFDRYHAYLSALAVERPPKPLADRCLYAQFDSALLSCHPKACYVNGPTRYAFYHWAMSVTPVAVRDELVKAFMLMPPWKKKGRDRGGNCCGLALCAGAGACACAAVGCWAAYSFWPRP